MPEENETKPLDARTARERMNEAKEALSSLTVNVESVKAAGKVFRLSDIGALTMGAYRRLKKHGITKENLLVAVNDPDKAVLIVAEALGLKPDECDELESPDAFAVVLHLAKKEQEKIEWRGKEGEAVRPS